MFGKFFNKNKKEETVKTNVNTSNTNEKIEDTKNAGGFLSFVLLKDATFDFEKFKSELSNKWGIKVDAPIGKDENYVFDIEDMMVALSVIDAPVPNSEAEYAASKNWMWNDAVNKSKEHKAHLIVSVLGKGSDNKKKGLLFVKLLEVCCGLENTLGIYVNGTVQQPELYKDLANTIDKNDTDEALPILNLVWIGFWKTDKGVSVYTIGLNAFGKDEMEIIEAKDDANTLHGVMIDLVTYVLDSDVTLRDGETIGFTAEQKWTITRSECVSNSGMSLKIGYN